MENYPQLKKTLTQYFNLKRDLKRCGHLTPPPMADVVHRELDELTSPELSDLAEQAVRLRNQTSAYRNRLQADFGSVQDRLREEYGISKIKDPEKPMLFDMDGPEPGVVWIDARTHWYRWSQDLATTVTEVYAKHHRREE